MRTESVDRNGRIIWQGHFLSCDYLPARIVGREEQQQALHMCLSPMKDGQPALNAWPYGPAGTGKTAVARSVAAEVCQSNSTRLAFYVNCWERRSLYSVVQAIAGALKVLGAEAQDTNVKLDRIRQVVKGRPAVVILDDIDRVSPSERGRIIHGILGMPHTSTICITNQRMTHSSLEEETRSRLRNYLKT